MCDQIQDIFQYPVVDQKEVCLKEMRYYGCFHSVGIVGLQI